MALEVNKRKKAWPRLPLSSAFADVKRESSFLLMANSGVVSPFSHKEGITDVLSLK